MQVLGLDGWRRGWVAVTLEGGRFQSAGLFPSVSHAIDAIPGAAVVAADIPIGLPETGRRACDQLARERLGPRRSSVFFAPPRDVVAIDGYAAANAAAKQRHGFGISKQSYMLRPKILEVDELVAAGAEIFEVHPDVAFRSLLGYDLAAKRTYLGIKQRLAALASVGIILPEDIGEAGLAPADDVIDAAVVAHVADRIGRGIAVSLPPVPQKDPVGRTMAIWH